MASNDEAGWVQGKMDFPSPEPSSSGTFNTGGLASGTNDLARGGEKLSGAFGDVVRLIKEANTQLERMSRNPAVERMLGKLAEAKGAVGSFGSPTSDRTGIAGGIADSYGRMREAIRKPFELTKPGAKPGNGGDFMVTSTDSFDVPYPGQGRQRDRGTGRPRGGSGQTAMASFFAVQQLANLDGGYLRRQEDASLNSGRWTQQMQGMGYMTGSTLSGAEQAFGRSYASFGGRYSGEGAAATADLNAFIGGMRDMGGGASYGGTNKLMADVARMSQANPHLGASGNLALLQEGARGTPSTLNNLFARGILTSRDDINDRSTFVRKVVGAAHGGADVTRGSLATMTDATSNINANLKNLGISQQEIVSMAQEEMVNRKWAKRTDEKLNELEAGIAEQGALDAKGSGDARARKDTKVDVTNKLKEWFGHGWPAKILSGVQAIGPSIGILVSAISALRGGKLATMAGGALASVFGKGGYVVRAGGWAKGKAIGLKNAAVAAGAGALSRMGSFLPPLPTELLDDPFNMQGPRLRPGGGIDPEYIGDPDGYAGQHADSASMSGRQTGMEDEEAVRLLGERTNKGMSHVRGLKGPFRRAIAAMFKANPRLRLNSGFRSIAHQKQLWEAKLREVGGDESKARRWVAPPGKSRHNYGGAADIGPASEQGWLAANAGKFGLHIPLSHEPWHVEPKGSRSGRETVMMAVAHSAAGAMGPMGRAAAAATAAFRGAFGGSERDILAAFLGGRSGVSADFRASGSGGAGTGAPQSFASGVGAGGGAGSMGMLDLARVARSAGFKGDEVAKAVAIAMAESRGNPSAIGDNTPQHLGKYAHLHEPGEQSTGLWQIHYRPSRDKGNPSRDPNANLNPAVNARNAYAIYQQQGWKAWSVTHDDAGANHYSNWMAQARSAVVGAGVGDPPEVGIGSGAPAPSPMVVTGGTTKTVNMYITSTGGDAVHLAKKVAEVLRDEHQFAVVGGV